MLIGGFQKQSYIDFPSHIAAVIFTKGCNFRCKYCHNPDLVFPELFDVNQNIPLQYIFNYLHQHDGLLDGVVITGGEPTLHPDLPQVIENIKACTHLKIKLDTNGTNPKMLSLLLKENLVDYVALDIKAALNIDEYTKVIGQCTPSTIEAIKQSCRLLLNTENVIHEFRTTLVKGLHPENTLQHIGLAVNGCKNYSIQQCMFEKTLYPADLSLDFYSDRELLQMKNDTLSFSEKVVVR